MKFLLVGMNAKYIHSNPAIYSLAAYADKFKDDLGQNLSNYIEIAEYTINQNLDDILTDIYRKKPDVIAFSCYIWNIEIIKNLICEIHKIIPLLPIWLGGPEVSFDPIEELKEYPFLTGIMVGEGEETFTDLIRFYLEKSYINEEVLQQIPGIVTKKGFTPNRECMDLDTIPFFYHDLNDFKNRIIYYESSRGCPFRCSYCLSSIDKKVRFRNLDLVKEELLFFIEHKVLQVKFIDRTFNANHDHAMSIWKYIYENDNGITNFHFEISADLLNDEEIKLLNSFRPGLVQLEIGVQSTNTDTISAINRTMDIDKLKYAVDAINRGNNIHQHLDLIAGLPYEDYESFRRSFNDVYNMHPEQLQLGFLKVLKGAKMYDTSAEYGIIYKDKPPYEVLFTKWLSFEDVIKLKRIESMVELFYNSNQFRNTVRVLEVAFTDAFTMYEKLAQYYEEQGYFTMSARRMYYYDILLKFSMRYAPSNEDVYKELLTFDCYLRENIKTRPEFALPQEENKEIIKGIYKNEMEKKSLSSYEGYDIKQISKMTHLEFFNYPVWADERDRIMTKLENRVPIIFDYKEKNPLTSDCRILFPMKGKNDK